MRMGVFKKGFSAVREEKQKQDENREKLGKNISRFFLINDGDEATVRFLTEEPVTFYEHVVKATRNGKDVYENHLCTQDDNCLFCAAGDKPSFKGAFLIWDTRPYEYTDREGKKQSGDGMLRLYVQGTRVLSQLDRISSKYGLTNRLINIIRLGKGTQTTYTIEKGDEVGKFSVAEIKNMLPEKLRDIYNGSAESLYNVIEEVLMTSIVEDDSSPANSSVDSSEKLSEEEDEEENLIDIEEVEIEKPKGKIPFKSVKVKENSVKKLFQE